MKAHIAKRTRRTFISRLKKKLSNTIKNESGSPEHLLKNKLQVKLKRYIKLKIDKSYFSTSDKRENISAPVNIDYYDTTNYHKTNVF